MSFRGEHFLCFFVFAMSAHRREISLLRILKEHGQCGCLLYEIGVQNGIRFASEERRKPPIEVRECSIRNGIRNGSYRIEVLDSGDSRFHTGTL